MIAILFLVLLFGISLILTRIDDYIIESVGVTLSWIWGVILVCFLLAIPISHYNFKLEISKFEARKETVYAQREMGQNDYERATLAQSIVTDNGWLATQQKNKELVWFNWFIPKTILEVKPIK